MASTKLHSYRFATWCKIISWRKSISNLHSALIPTFEFHWGILINTIIKLLQDKTNIWKLKMSWIWDMICCQIDRLSLYLSIIIRAIRFELSMGQRSFCCCYNTFIVWITMDRRDIFCHKWLDLFRKWCSPFNQYQETLIVSHSKL